MKRGYGDWLLNLSYHLSLIDEDIQTFFLSKHVQNYKENVLKELYFNKNVKSTQSLMSNQIWQSRENADYLENECGLPIFLFGFEISNKLHVWKCLFEKNKIFKIARNLKWQLNAFPCMEFLNTIMIQQALNTCDAALLSSYLVTHVHRTEYKI